MACRLYFLGAPRAECDGEVVDLPAKAIALLAFLALAGEPQPRDRILGLLWAESAQEAARKNLRNILWSIRKELGDAAILTPGDRLSLGPDVWVDALALLAGAGDDPGAASPDLYRGVFLDGLSLPDAPDYDIWQMGAQERLSQAAIRNAAALVEHHQRKHDWTAMAAAARTGLQIDSLHEPFYRALMEAHARLGERGEALRQYEIARATLERELGVTPLPETDAMRDAIRDGGYEPAAPVRPVPVKTQPRVSPPESLPFVGRDEQRAVLEEERSAASGGRPRVILLTGELGVGKSRLWREWCSAAGVSSTALEARCLEATQNLPFAPLVDLFSAHPCTALLYAPGSPVAPAWLAEVARLLPEVRERVPGLPPPASLPLEEERRRVFEAFVQVLLALDAAPLLVFIDDAHWIDRTSLDWLAYLIHRFAGRPLMLVLAYRPHDAPSWLIHQVAAWSRESLLRRVAVPRLDPGETAELLASLDVEPSRTHRLQAESGGNPYFLIELAKSDDPAAAPPVLADLIRSRVERLGEDARAVLAAAAILEDDFDLELLIQVSGREEDETLAAVESLLAAGILRETGSRLAFSHPFVAGSIRESLTGVRRTSLVRRAAQAVAAANQARPGLVAGRLASYHRELGDAEAAARYFEVAAGHALSLAAPLEALGLLRDALETLPSAGRRLALAGLLSDTGDLVAARREFLSVFVEAEATGERGVAARSCLGLAFTFLPAGRPDDVVEWAERSIAFLDASADPFAHAQAHFLLGAGRLRAGGPALAEAERHLREAIALAQEHDLPAVAASSRFELGNLFAERGELALAVEAYRESLAIARAEGDTNRQVLAHNNAAFHLMLLGELPEARVQIGAALDLAGTYDLQLPRQYLFSTRGEIALAEREWDEAEGWFQRSLSEATRYDNRENIAKQKANLAHAASARGDLDGALILLEEAADMAAPLTARYLQIQIYLWLAGLYVQREEQGAARAALRNAEERLRGGEYRRLTELAAELRKAIA